MNCLAAAHARQLFFLLPTQRTAQLLCKFSYLTLEGLVIPIVHDGYVLSLQEFKLRLAIKIVRERCFARVSLACSLCHTFLNHFFRSHDLDHLKRHAQQLSTPAVLVAWPLLRKERIKHDGATAPQERVYPSLRFSNNCLCFFGRIVSCIREEFPAYYV